MYKTEQLKLILLSDKFTARQAHSPNIAHLQYFY